MTRRRLILLLLCAALVLAVAHEKGVADELDHPCPSLCSANCAGEGGCLLYREVGCKCDYLCRSGVRGGTICTDR